MTVKGLTKKQLIMMIERNVRDDNCCITEDDMYRMMQNEGDTYNAELFHGSVLFTLEVPNHKWDDIRMFLPRVGDILKGMKT